jgi:UDP-glucose 4-epimerase
MKILVTGGTGYIGSNVAVQLLESGYDVIVLDSLSNSRSSVIERIKRITRRNLTFIKGDIRDRTLLDEIFKKHAINAVMHFAGLKSVADSEKNPLDYYATNVTGTVTLIESMLFASVRKMIFSSSATVYGNNGLIEHSETSPLNPINVYGKTKFIIEGMLKEIRSANPSFTYAALRYFNPVGAHCSGLLGEDPKNKPNNLMPILANVATGRQKELSIYGNDYNTPDGTCLRDYIHVTDLAAGHIAALKKIMGRKTAFTMNLGTGKPHSVLELITAFELVSGAQIPFKYVQRRKGDLDQYYANPNAAERLLGWTAELDLFKMCEDVWRWQQLQQSGH